LLQCLAVGVALSDLTLLASVESIRLAELRAPTLGLGNPFLAARTSTAAHSKVTNVRTVLLSDQRFQVLHVKHPMLHERVPIFKAFTDR
jgi:hypothetical protein